MNSSANTNLTNFPDISGYNILEQIYLGHRTIVYRALQNLDQRPVIIKILKQIYPSFNELVQFRHQYTITKNLNSPGIVKSLNLLSYQNGYVLVMEDCGSISLAEYSQQQPLTLINVLEIALQMADILYYIHHNFIIHKDIKPANILIHPETKNIKLIDFSISSLLNKETQEIQNPNILEGTLAYLAPEQTGRMNRGIDYRTDFYSLGVTLYELLTGQLPFSSNDALELVHCHIAKTPIPPHLLQENIPSIVSAIILKLMAKNAENRYQSALGLKYDLEKCLRQWQESGEIINFELGKRDSSDRFLIPEKLYGREQEVTTLLAAFDRITHGNSEMMLVAGFSGIGKTAVINEIHKPITHQKGYFIKGKFDQFNRNIPLFAFVQALGDLITQLLSESDTKLAQWRSKILTALGENGEILTKVIPELESIIGKQHPASEMSGNSAQNRFNLVFQKFIEVFTTSEHPLVIFLDDLQWADSASLQLIKILMEDKKYLLLLGAYRDNEVSPVHPFILTIEDLKNNGTIVNTISLSSLLFADINQLIADTLRCSIDIARPLTELIHRKTQGNPFFITQFLKALYEDKYINFNREQGYWQCNLVAINAQTLTDDVVEFMTQQLQKLPRETQIVLKLAACIGNQFDLNTLAIVSEKSDTETANALWKALQDGLIIPQNEVYKFYLNQEQANTQENHNNIEITYRFLHDRVQQAAYSLIPPEQKQNTHYHIGQLLREKIFPELQEERIFELVNHLNYGITLITSKTEKNALAKLNLIACRKARAGTAYQAAYQYAKIGLNLLGNEAWQLEYAMTLQFHEMAAEAAAINSDFAAMNELINTVIEHSKTILDQVGVYLIKIQALTIQNQFLEAIACGQLIITKLGVNFPENITSVELQQEIEEIKALIGDRPLEELLHLPPMVDKEKMAIIKIANRMVPACFLGNSPLFPLLASLQVKLSLQYGNHPISSTGYADYGIFLIAFKKDIATSNQFGQLAYHLASIEPDKIIRAVTFVPVGLYLYHHQFHLRDTIAIFQAGYEAALEVGKLDFVGHNVQGICVSYFWTGQILTELETQIFAYYQILLKFHLITSEKYGLIFLETIRFLLGFSNKMQIYGAINDQENIWIANLLNCNDVTRIFYIYFHRAYLRFLLGYINLAEKDILQARNYIGGNSATVCEAGLYLYDSLIILATISELSTDIETKLQKIEENQENLHLWATTAPMNYLHKWQLVEAEKQRILGNKLEAIEMYDQAIAGAKNNGYLQEEALANELAAKFYLAWGKEKSAIGYMQEAYYCYAHWGAKVKVTHLEENYPQLLAIILPQNPSLITSGVTMNTTLIKNITSTSDGQNFWLDFPVVMKAAQAISEEIELDKLLENLMEIVIKFAGAKSGHLVLRKQEKWVIVAKAEPSGIEILEIPLDEYDKICKSLIYSTARSQKTTVFDNLSAVTQFIGDRYIITHQPKSVLCTTISKQGKVIGILYLENNLTEAAFTRDRVEILQLLTSQAAISLENANLYQQIEKYSQTLEAEVTIKTEDLRQKTLDLEQTLKNLQYTQAQLIQSEKMSSLGQMVAGIAHEINNPVTFIVGNIRHAEYYVNDLQNLLNMYQQEYPQPSSAIQAKLAEIDLEFLWDDFQKIINSMKVGSDRISRVVLSLRNFSRLDESEMKVVDLHSGIESTLLILQNRWKNHPYYPPVKIIKNYSNLPKISCYPSQLNQVFMSLIINALDALQDDNNLIKKPEIMISIQIIDNNKIRISIADNGIGIPDSIQAKIFDPFFTTKPVGKGSGLGLTVSYAIVKKHGGQLTCNSTVGQGTEFVMEIPIHAYSQLI